MTLALIEGSGRVWTVRWKRKQMERESVELSGSNACIQYRKMIGKPKHVL